VRSRTAASTRSPPRSSPDSSAGASQFRRAPPPDLVADPFLPVCSVSLLTDFEVCDDYLDWHLGTHGIYVEFVDPALRLPPSSSSSTPASTATTPSTGSGSATPATKPTYRSLSALPKLDVAVSRAQNPRNLRTVLHATFLPEVAPAQGWSKVDAVDAAMRKGGFKGVVTEEMRRGARVSRYQSRKAKVSWDEWQRWRSSQ